MALALYKFGEQWGISDPSPFCVKLESFLKLNDITYIVGDFNIKSTIGKAPKKKIPFVDFENGERMGDSTLIIEHLSEELGIDMERHFTPEQRATSHAYRQMLDESLYFIIIYSRWIDDAGWDIIMPLFFNEIPHILRAFISKKIRRGVQKQTYTQGIARHTKEEIYQKAHKDLQALSTLLNKDQWFFGAKSPGLLDVWCHAYVINIIRPPHSHK